MGRAAERTLVEDPHDDRRPIRRLACSSIPADDPRLSGLASCMAANVSSGETDAGVLLVLIAVSARLWECIHVINVHQIHRLELLSRLTWLAGLIRNVEIDIYWREAGDEVYRLERWYDQVRRKLRGNIEDQYFGDRQAIYDRWDEEEEEDMPEDADEDADESEHEAYSWYLGQIAEYESGRFTQGPDGKGFSPFLKTADDAIKSLETSISRLQNLRSLGWLTKILPMSSSLCRHLSQLKSLRMVRLGPRGEFESESEYGNAVTSNHAWSYAELMPRAHACTPVGPFQ
jgi:hypothetical protein